MTVNMISQYEDLHGNVIIAKTELIRNSFHTGPTIYYAPVTANVGGEPLPIIVPLDAASPHEAFEVREAQVKAKFQGVVKQTLANMEEEMKKLELRDKLLRR